MLQMGFVSGFENITVGTGVLDGPQISLTQQRSLVEVAGPPSKARMNSELAEGEFIKLHEPSINENYTGSLK